MRVRACTSSKDGVCYVQWCLFMVATVTDTEIRIDSFKSNSQYALLIDASQSLFIRTVTGTSYE